MKKLKLNALNLGAVETLSREQMKQVLGGDDYGSYGGGGVTYCSKDEDCPSKSKCVSLKGLPSICSEVIQTGTTCSTDADCGNGGKCVQGTNFKYCS